MEAGAIKQILQDVLWLTRRIVNNTPCPRTPPLQHPLLLLLHAQCLVDPAGNLHFKASSNTACLCHQVGQLVGPKDLWHLWVTVWGVYGVGGRLKEVPDTRCRYICPSYANEYEAEAGAGAAASLDTANYRWQRTWKKQCGWRGNGSGRVTEVGV